MPAKSASLAGLSSNPLHPKKILITLLESIICRGRLGKLMILKKERGGGLSSPDALAKS